MEEIFKDIQGYEGIYQISNLGRVKSLNYKRSGKEKIMKLYINKKGYIQVCLRKQNKPNMFYVHRLVAYAFISNPFNFLEINHKDEDKTNNTISNLEWCSRQYNNTYGNRIKKTSKRVECIETGKIFNSISEVGREMGFRRKNIRRACENMKFTAYGYHWKFI